VDLESFPPLPNNIRGRYHSIIDYHQLYLSGELTPLAVVESLLPLIKRDVSTPSDHSIAFVDSHPDEVLEAARASTERYKRGAPLSIFDGVPTAIKDESKVAGYRTMDGRAENEAFFKVELESSWPVQKWLEAGGIVLGKLNMHEVGADTTNNNPNWGTPRNPHNDQYYTGGSSGGAAYAVSAGLVPMALGADGGGSIRIPASFCGVYGLKPSHGRLEDTSSTVTVTGPLAATMNDLEASYRLFVTPNPADSVSSMFAPPRSLKYPTSKKIGYCKTWFERADPIVYETCQNALSHFTFKLGYEIIDIELPYLPQGQLAHAFTILTQMAARARSSAPSSSGNFLSSYTAANKVLLGVGSRTPAYDYLLAQQLRNLLMQHLAHLFTTHPGLLIITPTTPLAGWPIDSPTDLVHGLSDANMSVRNMEYVWLANFTGCPAISVPVGYVKPQEGKGDRNVPIGLMAMGEWGSEDQLLDWGREAEGFLNDGEGRQKPRGWEDVIGNAKGKGIDS
jgi:Asp-tRNA(Asn)/Glu-tRNA(Gln) amidotransferase A subunit family amidase